MAPFTFLKWVLAYSSDGKITIVTEHESALLTFLLLLMCHLSQVAEVVSLHLQVEDFAVRKFGRGNQMRIEQGLRVKGCNIRLVMCATQLTTEPAVKFVRTLTAACVYL